jgi:hypothetical protein
MPPIKIVPTSEEQMYLEHIAVEDLRTPEQAIRWLIRKEAERRSITPSIEVWKMHEGAAVVEAAGAFARE